jgi:acyl-coenzyme A synthetase/AMP-(fatty) acid ligase
MDVRSVMRRTVGFNGDRPAVLTQEGALGFAEAWSRGCRLANALADLGCRPGDRVAALEDNGVAAADYVVACTAGNYVRNPLGPGASRQVLKFQLHHTQSRVLLVDPAHAAAVEGFENELPFLHAVVVRGKRYEGWLAGFPDEDPEPPVAEDDWYLIRHTGGTTGRPKGVGYTHRTFASACRDWWYSLPPIDRDGALAHLCPPSVGPAAGFVPAWMAGAANLLVPACGPTEALDALARGGASHLFVAPSQLAALVAAGPAARPWPELRCVAVGGAPLDPGLAQAAHRCFGDALHQFYGQTEVAAVAAMSAREWFGAGPEARRSVGRALPWVELEVWDEAGFALPPGEEGELVVRSDAQMLGLWGDPERTAARLRMPGNRHPEWGEKPWVRTGDMGRVDPAGYLHLTRRKDAPAGPASPGPAAAGGE